jgi:hypothetical protein
MARVVPDVSAGPPELILLRDPYSEECELLSSRLLADRRLMGLSQVCLTVEDGLARIEVCGVFDVGAATAVRAEFHEIGALADAVLLDLRAVTELEEGFDVSGFVDEIQRYCWISGCRLRLVATHPSLVAALARQEVSSGAVVSG